FKELSTYDFEQVIKNLIATPTILNIYGNHFNQDTDMLCNQMREDASKLKDILVSTIAKKHPNRVSDVEDRHYSSCRQFISKFSKVYTLNYDLLLYWSMLHDDPINKFKIDDGFRHSDHRFGEKYRTFESPHSPTFFFLHGALHIFDAGSEVRKFTWVDTRTPLIEQIRSSIDQGMFPLFVSEGDSEEKMTKINHSSYLSKALRSFEAICEKKDGALFIFGHSLDENDAHILKKIDDGKIATIFISLFNHPQYGYDQATIDRALRLGNGRGHNRPSIILFDSASANVWGKS
ncbi:MAG: DUF4917 family protein, partial [Vampirovibrionales bacterium]|nr:DUF4917 family protein [Vampirovibrionales bacterium]